ncbi:MAG: hypothetical protein ACJ748_00485, partial [Flavisolibacter sp.]
MKKPMLWCFCIILISALTFILIHRSHKPHLKNKELTAHKLTLSRSDEDEDDDQDGPEKELRHEFIMTLDPALGRIPYERYIEARTKLEASKNQRTEGTSNITWSERGPNNIGGRTRAILIDASDGTGNTVWAGSVGGGLWKTTNFKAATPVWANVPGIVQNLAITCIAQHPSNPSIIYVGTGEGYGNIDAIRGLGVYQTTDGGANWSLIASTTTGGASVNDFTYVQKLMVYTNGDVYASCSSKFCNRGGVFRMLNGGSTWTRVIGVSTGSCYAGAGSSTDMTGMDIERSVSGDIYASTIDYSTGVAVGKIWKSPAGATVGNAGTWTNISPAGSFQRIELECSATNNSKIYALTQGSGSATGGTRLSTDGGTTWSTIDVGNWCDQGTTKADFTRGQAWYDLTLASSPSNDALVFAGGVDIFKTANSGTAWAQATQWSNSCGAIPSIHADIHAIKFFPGSSTEFIVGCDGGLYYTNDGGTTFTSKNSSYNVTEYYGLAMNPNSGSNYFLAGAQDNGSHKFSSGGINSVSVASGGDGGQCFIDSDNPNLQYTSFTGASFNFSNNGGTTFNYLGSISADRFINPADYDPSTDHLYCGGPLRGFERVYNFTTSSASADGYTIASSANNSVSAVKVDPNTANRVWVAYSTGDGAGALAVPELYIINNANTTPVATTVTLPAGIASSGNYISSLDIETGNANHIILTLSNYGVNSIWESADGGTTWATLDNATLPDVPVRFCKFLPSGYSPGSRIESVGGIVLATEMGVWSTAAINGSSTVWMANNAGMGNVRVDRIEFRSSDKTLGVATHGRGIFTGTITIPLPVSLIEFSGKLNGSSADIKWTTSYEQDTKDFEIQRSEDGQNFIKIGDVTAAGKSFSTRHYAFNDPQLNEINYYRLKMNDRNGDYKLSQVIMIKYENKPQAMTFTNPFKNYIDISIARSAKSVKLQLLTTNGSLIMQKEISNASGRIRWQLSSAIGNGVYILKAYADDILYTGKLVRN